MMISTQWHGEFVADLASECSGLCKFEMMCTTGRYIGLITVQALLLTIGFIRKPRFYIRRPEAALGARRLPPLRFRNPECRSDYSLQMRRRKASLSAGCARVFDKQQATGATHFDEVTGPELTSGTDININTRHCLLCHADELVSPGKDIASTSEFPRRGRQAIILRLAAFHIRGKNEAGPSSGRDRHCRDRVDHRWVGRRRCRPHPALEGKARRDRAPDLSSDLVVQFGLCVS
jgi:hypothetical protein